MPIPRLQPARLTLVRHPFNDPDFLFELKHDGFRALAYISDGTCELVSRNRNSYKSFNSLREVLGKLPVKNAVLDGEIVCLDSEGRSIFNELLYRKGYPVFYAFDVLYMDNRDLRQVPLIERKTILHKIIGKNKALDVVCGKWIEEFGTELYNEICRRNLEGIVAKRKRGTYNVVSGWLKIKNPEYTQAKGRFELFDSFKRKTVKPVRAELVPSDTTKKPPKRSPRFRSRQKARTGRGKRSSVRAGLS